MKSTLIFVVYVSRHKCGSVHWASPEEFPSMLFCIRNAALQVYLEVRGAFLFLTDLLKGVGMGLTLHAVDKRTGLLRMSRSGRPFHEPDPTISSEPNLRSGQMSDYVQLDRCLVPWNKAQYVPSHTWFADPQKDYETLPNE